MIYIYIGISSLPILVTNICAYPSHNPTDPVLLLSKV